MTASAQSIDRIPVSLHCMRHVACLFTVIAFVVSLFLVEFVFESHYVPSYKSPRMADNVSFAVTTRKSPDNNYTVNVYDFPCPSTISEVNGVGQFHETLPLFLTNYTRQLTSEEELIHLNKLLLNCSDFLASRKYILSSLQQEEENFPIAYSMIIYKDVVQVERLLRAIYRPQNLYCIHVDKSASNDVFYPIRNISKCLKNVVLPVERIDVAWGTISVVSSEMACMRALLKTKPWKYFINLVGQEFPLKTNSEIVKILKSLNGLNLVSGIITQRIYHHRHEFKHIGRVRTNATKNPPPHNLTIYKGDTHIIAQRGFVEYAVNNPIAKDLLLWLNDTLIPDEHFFSTLNYNLRLNVPGNAKTTPALNAKGTTIKPGKALFIPRFKLWWDTKGIKCNGKQVRGICIFGALDVPLLVNRKELFANKFFYDFQPFAYDCLDEWLYSASILYASGQRTFNVSYYTDLYGRT